MTAGAVQAVPHLRLAKPDQSGLPEATIIRRDVRLHGQRISFLETGETSGGPVLLLLHGLAGSSNAWR
jgi:pimeloyl-ACP methyl ester carboxylesterase